MAVRTVRQVDHIVLIVRAEGFQREQVNGTVQVNNHFAARMRGRNVDAAFCICGADADAVTVLVNHINRCAFNRAVGNKQTERRCGRRLRTVAIAIIIPTGRTGAPANGDDTAAAAAHAASRPAISGLSSAPSRRNL